MTRARAKGYDARIEVAGEADEVQPEFGNSRRRFIIAALMAGWIKPDTLVARIVGEVDAEA